MAVRVISGVLVPGSARGSVTFHFNDHSISPHGGGVRVDEVRDIGPRRRFSSVPCKTVSLREIVVQETERPISRERIETDLLRLGDEITQDWLEISWHATGGSEIKEVSFMVIGEVPD